MITLVNTFEVLNDDTTEFERVFHETATFVSKQAGFLGYHLVRSVQDSRKYFNMAGWASLDDLRAALGTPQMREHHELVSTLATTDPHPCITVFEVLDESHRVQ